MQTIWAEQLSPESRADLPPAIEGFVRDTYETIPPIYVESRDNDMYSGQADMNLYKSVIGYTFNPFIPGYMGRAFKTVSSAFDHGRYSDLNTTLGKLGAKELILSGGFTSYCIYETAVDGAALGYKVSILDDLSRDTMRMDPDAAASIRKQCEERGVTFVNSANYKRREEPVLTL